MVPASDPGALVGRVEQGLAFGAGEPADVGGDDAAAVDGQDLADDVSVLGRVEGGVAEQRVDRG